MPRPRDLPDDSVLLRLRDLEDLSYQQVADRYGVTKQAVGKRFAEMGRALGNEAPIDYASTIPWRIKREHMALDAPQRLRAHLRAKSGVELTPAAKRRLESWYERLQRERVVLDYDAESSPPFRYVTWEESDDGLLVRVPAGVELSEQQRKLLQLAGNKAGLEGYPR